MKSFKLESSNPILRKKNIQIVRSAKMVLKVSCLALFLYCTIGTSSIQAQFVTTFAPAFYNPTDPGNTNWNEPKNWSWYPGSFVGHNVIINVMSNANNNSTMEIPYSSTINISSGVTLEVHDVFINAGTISGDGTLKLSGLGLQNNGTINCKEFIAGNVSNNGTIDCDIIRATQITDFEAFSAGDIVCRQDCKMEVTMQDLGGTFINEGTYEGTVINFRGYFENNGSSTGSVFSFDAFGRNTNNANMTIDASVESSIVRLVNNEGANLIINSSLKLGGGVINNFGTIVNNNDLDLTYDKDFPGVESDFTIVNAGTRTGTYGTVNLPDLDPGLEWEVEYNYRDVTLRVAATLVPVTWLDFTASVDERDGNEAILRWSTAEEINNLGFEVERSEDGRNWEQIGFEAAQTRTADQYDYEFIDLNPIIGLNYYRLKQVDYDGHYEYSEVRSIQLNDDVESFSAFPNPSSFDVLNIKLKDEESEDFAISIFDLNGRMVLSQEFDSKNAQTISLSTHNLNAGTYLIFKSGSSIVSQVKWVKL